MSRYPDGILSGAHENPHHADVLGPDPESSEGGGALRARLTEPSRCIFGGPLLSTIFNMVDDAVIQHWVKVLGVPPGGHWT